MWIALSVGAMGLLSAMLLCIVAAGRAGVPATVVLLYLFAVGLLFNLACILVQGTSLRLPHNAVPWIVGAGAASFLANVLYFKAMNLAPNPGYPVAIEGCKTLLVAGLSVWLFAAQFSAIKVLGAACCAVGVMLICL